MPTTTIDAIRDRMIELIKAITPIVLEHDAFRPSLDEDDAAFIEDCESEAAGCLRRFQVRDTGDRRPPDTTNTDVEAVIAVFEILVAYPQTARAGSGEARARDRMMDQDERLIGNVVGLTGFGNFGPTSSAPCSLVDFNAARAKGTGVDFLIIRQVVRFYRSRTP